ncbi:MULTISPECIES: SRPBCC family protein [Paraburkholderia]|uniref:SRPBCC family protein n=1 Tax=Paraburkholderia TaxID=1822464 RepID=UPI002AB2EC55|nr:SRPBCC family protein [Paraburkholderia tropica]
MSQQDRAATQAGTHAAQESVFVYVTYIRTAPQALWTALTSPEFTARYWHGVRAESDWQPGSPWQLRFADGRVADSGEIVESEPPHRLVIRWRNQFRPDLNAEGDSLCTMEIVAQDDVAKLTVTHRMARPGSKFIEAVAGGWPLILSNLKTLLETGEVMMPLLFKPD